MPCWGLPRQTPSNDFGTRRSPLHGAAPRWPSATASGAALWYAASMCRSILVGTCSAALLLTSAQVQAGDKPAADTVVLPPAPVSMSVEAPSAVGPWTLRVQNTGEAPMRIHADGRLMQLLVAPAGKGYTSCVLPGPLHEGDGRELELKPGDVYLEKFDPQLFCFGKVIDQMGEGTSVTAFWGYKPDAARMRAKKPQVPPFIVEAAQAPATFEPDKRLVSLTTWIPAPPAPASAQNASSQPAPDAKQPPDKSSDKDKPTPINTARLVLDPVRLVDAPTMREAKVSVTLKNVGDRAALVHVRPDLLEFTVTLPGGKVAACGMKGLRRAPVRDFFHSLGPKGSETLSVLLNEACPRELFGRPGVYEIRTVLHARWNGKEFGLSALTGDFEGEHTTLVRLQDAKERYYSAPPQVEAPKGK
jgi:hypothetical protein